MKKQILGLALIFAFGILAITYFSQGNDIKLLDSTLMEQAPMVSSTSNITKEVGDVETENISESVAGEEPAIHDNSVNSDTEPLLYQQFYRQANQALRKDFVPDYNFEVDKEDSLYIKKLQGYGDMFYSLSYRENPYLALSRAISHYTVAIASERIDLQQAINTVNKRALSQVKLAEFTNPLDNLSYAFQNFKLGYELSVSTQDKLYFLEMMKACVSKSKNLDTIAYLEDFEPSEDVSQFTATTDLAKYAQMTSKIASVFEHTSYETGEGLTDAIQYLGTLEFEQPEFTQLRDFEVAKLYAEIGKHKQTNVNYLEAIRRLKDISLDLTLVKQSYVTLGDVYFELGKVHLALYEFSHEEDLIPTAIDYLTNASKHYEAAEEHYNSWRCYPYTLRARRFDGDITDLLNGLDNRDADLKLDFPEEALFQAEQHLLFLKTFAEYECPYEPHSYVLKAFSSAEEAVKVSGSARLQNEYKILFTTLTPKLLWEAPSDISDERYEWAVEARNQISSAITFFSTHQKDALMLGEAYKAYSKLALATFDVPGCENLADEMTLEVTALVSKSLEQAVQGFEYETNLALDRRLFGPSDTGTSRVYFELINALQTLAEKSSNAGVEELLERVKLEYPEHSSSQGSYLSF